MSLTLLVLSIFLVCMTAAMLMSSRPRTARAVFAGLLLILSGMAGYGLWDEYPRMQSNIPLYGLAVVAALAAVAAYILFTRSRASEMRFVLRLFSQLVHPQTVEVLIDAGIGSAIHWDGLWIAENEAELREKYGGKWIAVVGQKVLASAATADEAWQESTKKDGSRPPFVRFIAEAKKHR